MKESVQLTMTLFAADVCGKYTNCDYPNEIKVTDEESLIQAVSRDYVGSEFADHRRSMKNFLVSDCLAMDCDNDHSEDPAQWVTPETVAAAFEDVTFAVHFSRNHQKEKDGKPARPRFHVLFPIQPVKSAKQYAAMKQRVQMYFPAFDRSAMDAARFFYGTENPEVKIFQGSKTLTAFLKELENGQSKQASGQSSGGHSSGPAQQHLVSHCGTGFPALWGVGRNQTDFCRRRQAMLAALGAKRTEYHLEQCQEVLSKDRQAGRIHPAGTVSQRDAPKAVRLLRCGPGKGLSPGISENAPLLSLHRFFGF